MFALGVDAAADTATLYRVDPQTGAATPIGTAGQIRFPVEFPPPGSSGLIDLPAAAAGYGFDFNPTVDRIRVTTGTGLNFRVNPDTGAAVDGQPLVDGIQPDANINGSGSTGVTGVAYTNSFGQPLTTPAGATTQYTLDAATNTLFIQNPSNGGTQTAGVPVTRLVFFGDAGQFVPFDFTAVNGFDIPAGVRADTAGGPAAGRGFALLTDAGGTTLLYAIDLATGRANSIGVQLPAAAGLAVGDAPVGTVAFAADTALVNEGAGTVTLTLVRTGGSAGVVSVDVTPGIDGSGPRTVTFADGQTTATVVFPIPDDSTDEVDQSVILTLANPTNGAVLGTPTTTNLTILDDDTPTAPGAVGFSAERYTVSEAGATATITLTRTGGSAGAFTVALTVTGGTATNGTDYGPVPTTVAFADGQTTATVTIPITNDILVEGEEGVVLTLSDPTNGVALTRQGAAALDITDDERAGSAPFAAVRFASAAVAATEGSGSVTLTLIRSDASTAAFFVNVSVTGGTATAGVDFSQVTTQVYFAQGQTTATVGFLITNDALVEGTETVVLTLSNPSDGATVGVPATATVTLADDPAAAVVALPFLIGGPPGGVARLFTAAPGNNMFVFGNTVTFPGIPGGARVAVADINGDRVPDYIGGAGPGAAAASRLVVIDGQSNATLVSFDVFEAGFTGGLFVAAADLDGDGTAEVVVTPDQGGGPVVAVYRGSSLAAGTGGDAAQIIRFFGIEDPAFRGGARPALGDVNGDGRADLVVSAGFLGGPRVALFDGRSLGTGGTPVKLVGDFFAFENTLRNGSFVAVGDLTGDGKADLVFGGGPGGGPRVRVIDGAGFLANGGVIFRTGTIKGFGDFNNERANFFAGDPGLRGGVRVAVHDSNGDGQAELLTGSGDGEASRVRLYLADMLRTNLAAPGSQEADPFGAVLANGVFVG